VRRAVGVAAVLALLTALTGCDNSSWTGTREDDAAAFYEADSASCEKTGTTNLSGEQKDVYACSLTGGPYDGQIRCFIWERPGLYDVTDRFPASKPCVGVSL